MGEQALKFFQALYDVERDVADLDSTERRAQRLERAKPVADALKLWLDEQRQKVPDGSATAKALDYSRQRWEALTRYLDDGRLPIDNNWVENQIRPIARALKLALRRQSARGQASSGRHELAALGAHQRAGLRGAAKTKV